jgi:transcriptional regulator with XRE-family HTH domain
MKSTARFGDRLVALLNQSGLTQAQLGQKAGLSATMISRLIHNQKRPSLDQADKIAAALDVSTQQMLHGTDAEDLLAEELGADVADVLVQQRIRLEIAERQLWQERLTSEQLRGELAELLKRALKAEARFHQERVRAETLEDALKFLQKKTELGPDVPRARGSR